MSRYLGIVGGFSGSFAILVQNRGADVIFADDDNCGMDWRESRTAGDPRSVIHRLKDRIAAQMRGPLSYDAVAVAISGGDARQWPIHHRFALKHVGFAEARTEISSLAEAAYWGVFGGRSGILVRSGHGSSFFGSDGRQKQTLLGGWGSISGASGSACWIGREALQAFCSVVDGQASRGVRAFVERLLLDETGTRTPLEVINQLEEERHYGGGFCLRKALFALGLKTLRLAELGDEHATFLTDEALKYLTDRVLAVYQRLGEPGEIPVALAGSAFACSPGFAAGLGERISHVLPVSAVEKNAEESVFWTVTGIAMQAIRKSEDNADQWMSTLRNARALRHLRAQAKGALGGYGS
jgi:N-acetylglucosamine kinase-like BadF-type ATPase